MNCMIIKRSELNNIFLKREDSEESLWIFNHLREFVESHVLTDDSIAILCRYAIEDMAKNLNDWYGWDFDESEKSKLTSQLMLAVKGA